MGTTEKISTLNRVIANHDIFIFDLCGVVHDGISLIGDSVKFIDHLRKLDKSVIFISNSSKKASRMSEFLISVGLNIDGCKVMTSGEFFLHTIKTSGNIPRKLFNIGGMPGCSEEESISFVPSLDDSDGVVISVIAENLQNIGKYQKQLEDAAKKGKSAFCINPDLYAPHGDIVLYTPGYFAREYEKLGGKVTYLGKPYSPIYQFALSEHLQNQGFKERTIAVGDSLLTDIKGARDFGIKSLLVLRKGLHKDLYGHTIDDLNNLCNEYNIYPNYIADDLVI